MIDLFALEGVSDLRRGGRKRNLLQFRTRIVIILHVRIGHMHAAPETLIDETQHGQLPNELRAQLILREAITRERGAARLKQLAQHRIRIRILCAGVTSGRQFLPNDLLIYQTVRGLMLRLGAFGQRHVIQESRDPEIPIDVAQLHHMLTHNNRDTIDHRRRVGGTRQHQDKEYAPHQKVCPIEKKNWRCPTFCFDG